MMHPLIWLIDTVLSVASLLLLVYIIMQWLAHFKIINRYQPFVAQVMGVLARTFEPVLGRIRRFLGVRSAVDLSPIILFIAIEFVQYSLRYYAF